MSVEARSMTEHEIECEKINKEKDKRVFEMQSHIDCLKAELEEIQMNKQELPEEPIKVAEMLISATGTYTNLLGKKQDYNVYDKSELRQIAEHLLVYCNHAEEV